MEISAVGPSSCHPTKTYTVEPCTVVLRADARDPEGGPVRVRWSGCTSGEDTEARCQVDRPGTFTARVVATDREGARTPAERKVEGTNAPPSTDRIRFGCTWDAASARSYASKQAADCWTLPVGAPIICVGGNVDMDTEGDFLVCPSRLVEGGAACRPAPSVVCGGAGDAYDFDLHAPSAPGVCVYDMMIADAWGAEALVDRICIRGVNP